MNTQNRPGELLRQWRQRRRRSQLDLACEAQISTRHLSFVETGRARPSRALILKLGDMLELSLRERNRLLMAAGFAPAFAERELAAPDMQQVLAVMRQILDAHDPNPAVVIDSHWNLVLANASAQRLLGKVDPGLMQPVANMLRISLHPQGLAPAIVNLGEWRQHLLSRLRRMVSDSADPTLAALLAEISQWPPLPGERTPADMESPLPDLAVLFRLRSPIGELALLGTITVFGSPRDVTLSELALESFYPADEVTGQRLRELAALGT